VLLFQFEPHKWFSARVYRVGFLSGDAHNGRKYARDQQQQFVRNKLFVFILRTIFYSVRADDSRWSGQSMNSCTTRTR
jgi:hypothetical protein